MGRASRQRPARIAEKLLEIRTKLELSQNGILKRMGIEDDLTREEVSAFERGIRVPPLPVLLKYARVAGICLDDLVDDELDLPEMLPSKPEHKVIANNTIP
jgi:transcriptional regulator with XRE-family HTH domain